MSTHTSLPSETVGMRDARANLSRLLRRAQRGETILLTIDDCPVAQLGPITPDTQNPTLEGLAFAGAIDRPSRHDHLPIDPPLDAWIGRRIDTIARDIRGRS